MSIPNIPRRRIDEIIALHEREPSLREFIVEGIGDKRFFEWFLGAHDCLDVSVLEISTIDVPTAMVMAEGLEDGNRGRIIALANALCSADGRAQAGVTCIVDADFDPLLGVQYDCPVLLSTDFACVEAYRFTQKIIQKVINLVLARFPKSAATVMAELSRPLQDLFLVRAANHVAKLGLNIDIPNSASFYKSLRLTSAGFELDLDKYLTALLASTTITNGKARILAIIATLRRSMKDDPRCQMNGHDFERAFALYVRRHKGFGAIDFEVIAKSLCTAVERADLESWLLFQRLIERAKSNL